MIFVCGCDCTTCGARHRYEVDLPALTHGCVEETQACVEGTLEIRATRDRTFDLHRTAYGHDGLRVIGLHAKEDA